MSLNSAFYITSTAMRSHGSALGVIADNVANVSSNGYRRREIDFSSLLGSDGTFLTKSKGAQAKVTQRVDANGAYAGTSRGLDAALGGRAMFAVQQGESGGAYYTRNGNFQIVEGESGTLRLSTANGYYLQGWPVSNGTVSQSLELIEVPTRNEQIPGQATTAVGLADNLPATASVGDTHERSITVYDSDGNPQDLTYTFQNTGLNSWSISASVTGGTATVGAPATLTIDPSTGFASGTTSYAVSASFPGGSTAAYTTDISAMSMTGGEFVTRGSTNDGVGPGLPSNFYFDQDGFLNVSYSNGVVSQLYLIPGAVFPNTNGLKALSNDVFSVSTLSGEAELIDTRGSELGQFRAATIEQSNVDLGTEFSTMIVTQRAYSTAATAFRTVDEMTQTVRDLR